MRLSAAARFRMMAVASLVAMLAAVGFLVIDRDGSTVQAANFGFSPTTVSAITVEVGRSPSYTAPNLVGMGTGKKQCYQATVALSTTDSNLNGLHVRGYQKGFTAGKITQDLNNIKIKGKASAIAAEKTYTVTATCTLTYSGQSATTVSYTIPITVIAKQPVPMAFSSATVGPIKLVKGQELLAGNDKVNNPIGQAVSGDTVGTVTYSISPAIGNGLSFSTSTGKITGTPTAAAAAVSYTVTATDSRTDPGVQTAEYTVDIEVVEPFAFPSAVVSHTLYQDDVRPTIPIAEAENARGMITYESPDKYGGTTASRADLGLAYIGVPTGFEYVSHGDEPLGVHRFEMTATETYRGHVRQTATVRFVFTMKLPKEFRYLNTDLGLQVVNQGATVSIDPPTSEWSVGAVTYAISPPLPTGLTLSPTGGVTGTAPSTAVKKTRYTVTATDSKSGTAQTASYSFDLLVKHASTMSFVPSALGTIDVEVNEEAHYAFQPHTPLLVNVAAGCTPVPMLQEQVNGNWVNAGNPGTTGTIRMVPSPTKTPPENYARYYIEGSLPASEVGQTTHYRFTLLCNHGNVREEVRYTFALQGIPQKMKFKPNDLGEHVVYKGVEYTFQPPELVAATGAVTYANTTGRNLPGGSNVVDANTGVISGTPTLADQGRTYTITATDSTSPTPQTASFTIRLSVSEEMSFASASLPDQTLTVGTAMTALNPPTLSNSVSVVRYTVSPNISAGLRVDNSTGVISGTPNATSAPTTYTITATDSTSPTPQTDTFTVNIKVNPATAMAFSGTKSDQVLAAGHSASITALAPTNSVGTLAYSITPALPNGLSLSTTSGAITGTPTAASASRSYTIAVTDSNSQSASYSFNITVVKPTVSFSAATSSPGEDAGTHNVAVSLSPAPAAATTVAYTGSGSATSGSDYSTLSGSVSVAKSATTVNIPVTITDDSVDDDDETIILTLSSGGNYYTVGSTSVHTATITDNDDPPALPVVSLVANDTEVEEGVDDRANASIKINSTAHGSTTVYWTASATGGLHSTTNGFGSNSWTFAQGAHNTQHINIWFENENTTTDGVDEPNATWTFTVNASVGNYTIGNPSTLSIPVIDGDPTIVSLARVDSGNIAEGGTSAKANAEFTVTLGRQLVAGETIEVPLILSGTGVTADDVNIAKKSGAMINKGVAVGSGGSTTPTVTFTGHDTDTVRTATLLLTSPTDSDTDSAETITVALGPDDTSTIGFDNASRATNVGGGADPHSTAKTFDVSVDSETAPTPVLTIAGGSAVTEGTAASFTVNASPSATGSITVKYTVTQSGAFVASGNLSSQTVSLSGGSATITVATVGDTTDEASGSVTVTLNAGTGYTLGSTKTATVTVNDDDDPPPATPVVSITAGSAVAEGTVASFTLSASPAPGSAVTLKYTVTQSGLFVASGDLSTQTVSMGTGSGTITVPTVDDSLDEANGSVTVTLNSGTGYSVHNSDGAATVTVTDDDVTEVSFATATSSGAEGSGTKTVRVNLSPAPATSLTLNYTVSGTATSGSDYTSIGTSVSVPSGSSSVNISVPIRDDSADEVDETVIITLAAGSHYTIDNSANVHTLTITDTDVPAVSFGASTSNIAEGGRSKNITVNISPAPATGLTVAYTVSGTATSGSDYTAPSGSLSVAAGQTTVTIPVAVLDDSVVNESSETVILTLLSGTGYTKGSPSVHTLSINDNDGTPTVRFNTSSATIMEGPSKAQSVRINLSPAPTSQITLRYNIGGTATAGSDYNTLSGSKTVTAGSTSTTISVVIIDDSIEDTGETVVLTLQGGTGYTVGSPSTFTLTITNDDRPASTPARSQRKAYIPSDPPNFCRGAVSEVADPPQQPFPTLGREVAPQRPCRGSGTLTLHDLADTLDDDQTKLERGFYITAQLHSTSDYRSRFRGGSGSKLYVVDSSTEARYQLLGGARRMIELSLWLIVKNPIQDSNTVARLGREAGLSEEFSICLPYEPTKRQPVADIARWDPSSLSWDILEHTLTESDDQVCALTDQVSSFVLVTPEPQPSASSGIPQPGDPQ